MSRRARFEVYENKGDEFAFRFRAANSKVICAGEGYKRHIDVMRAIEIIQTLAADADIEDSTRPQEPVNATEPAETRPVFVVMEVKDQINRGLASYDTREEAEKDADSRPPLPGVRYEVEEGTETVI